MSLVELVRLFKRRIALVIALPVLFGAATAVVCWGFMPDQYNSQVSLYVVAKGENVNASNATDSVTADGEKLAEDVLVIARDKSVLDATARTLQLATLVGYDIDVVASSTNRMLTITVVGSDPESVALIADCMAVQISEKVASVMDVEAVNIANTAAIPQTPFGPPRVLYTVVAVLIGLVLAAIVVLLSYALNPAVRSKKEAEQLLGVPVVGRMPFVKDLE